MSPLWGGGGGRTLICGQSVPSSYPFACVTHTHVPPPFKCECVFLLGVMTLPATSHFAPFVPASADQRRRRGVQRGREVFLPAIKICQRVCHFPRVGSVAKRPLSSGPCHHKQLRCEHANNCWEGVCPDKAMDLFRVFFF